MTPHSPRLLARELPTYGAVSVTSDAPQSGCVPVRLDIYGAPRRLRPLIEHAFVVCLPTPGDYAPAGSDLLDAAWHTQWRPSAVAAGAVDCIQQLAVVPRELAHLDRVLRALGQQHGFAVEVRRMDGADV